MKMQKVLLDEVMRIYRSCNSYRDSGSAIGKLGRKAVFATYFVKPNLFHFEWATEDGGLYKISAEGENAVYCANDRLTKFSRTMAFRLFSHIAYTPVYFIYGLLLPDTPNDTYHLNDYGPFHEIPAENPEHTWIKSDDTQNVQLENILVDVSRKTILERQVVIRSTESEAKENAAKYFESSDEAFSRDLAKEGSSAGRKGISFGSKFAEVNFDDLEKIQIEKHFDF